MRYFGQELECIGVDLGHRKRACQLGVALPDRLMDCGDFGRTGSSKENADFVVRAPCSELDLLTRRIGGYLHRCIEGDEMVD